MKKTESYLKKNPKWRWKIITRFLRGRDKRRVCWACGRFLLKSDTLENYSNFKGNFLFNNGSILEIHDYFRTREISSFNDSSQLIYTLLNQDFSGLYKLILRESLAKIKGMHLQLVKVSKNNRNESSLSKFLSSPFSPAMPKPMPMGNTSLPLVARENVSLKLKKRDSLLESKLQASSEKISSLQGTVCLLNLCIED